jgi:signal peptidase I
MVAAAALIGWLLLPSALGGQASFVTTHGNSMAPRFHTGDLAVIMRADHYAVGDVVAYHSHSLKQIVLHRIIAVNQDRYTFKGDHNSWVDQEQPTRSDLLGTLVVRVPQGGIWFKRATGPPALAAIAFLMAIGGGTAIHVRRSRRRGTVIRHSPSRNGRRGQIIASITTWSPALRIAVGAVAVVGILGVALGALAFTRPVDQVTTGKQSAARSMTFSYSAQVAPTPAYDGTTVESPDPIFRRLADTVEVHFSYQGAPGSVSVAAELSTASGWHSTLPLAAATTFTRDRYKGVVRLDLASLDRRAAAAASATGMPASQVTVAVVTKVTTPEGGTFAPNLRLILTPLQLTLAGGAASLTVKDDTQISRGRYTERTLGLPGHPLVTVGIARTLSVILLLLALLMALPTAVALALGGRRSVPASEAARILRRHASLLVHVDALQMLPGIPVAEVREFKTLARLGERYGLLVLHWSEGDEETYVVQDQGTIYRYRAGGGTTAHPTPMRPLDVLPR